MTAAPDILVVPDYGGPWVLTMTGETVARVPPTYPGLHIGKTILVKCERYKLNGKPKKEWER